MNERIIELAQKAWTMVSDEERASGEVYETDRQRQRRDQVFAELIVGECIEQLVKEGDAWEQFSRNPPQGQETNASAALFAAYRLKEDAVSRLEEHFGVEE
jgi:hypothetical protein